jgi:hypothetical protein
MKVIDCYYRFEKLNNSKSKTRFDLVYCSDIYEPLNQISKTGEFWVYLQKGEHVISHGKRKPDLALSIRTGHHLTGVYIPEIERPNLAFGDCSQDALLFIIAEGVIEVLICKGKKNLVQNLFNLLYDGEFDSEIDRYRMDVKKPVQHAESILSEVSL